MDVMACVHLFSQLVRLYFRVGLLKNRKNNNSIVYGYTRMRCLNMFYNILQTVYRYDIIPYIYIV